MPTKKNDQILFFYNPLLRQVLQLCEEIYQALKNKSQRDVPKDIILGFLNKNKNTLEAIILLYEHALHIEAQSNIRIIFELMVTFDAFLSLLKENPKGACMRVLDSMMLEKAKQQRASNYLGYDMIPGAPTPEDWPRIEKEIAARYSDLELKQIRRNGFSGLNVEERARQAGYEEDYNVVYRNFSLNIHSEDFMELMITERPELLNNDPISFHYYVQQRNIVACEIAFISGAYFITRVNDIYHLGFEYRIKELSARLEEVRNATRT